MYTSCIPFTQKWMYYNWPILHAVWLPYTVDLGEEYIYMEQYIYETIDRKGFRIST